MAMHEIIYQEADFEVPLKLNQIGLETYHAFRGP